MREVVVTGVGYVGAAGVGREALSACLAAGEPTASLVETWKGAHRPGRARTAALVGSLDTSRWIAPIASRRMGRPARFALSASRMALESAGVPGSLPDATRSSVVLGTAFGPVLFTERLLQQILRESPEVAQPALFTECVANAAAAQVAIGLGIRGANVTITQTEVSPLLALGRAAREVASGRCELVLAGAVEEMTSLLHAILDRFGALARPGETRPEKARPFDANRDGFLAGEGATILVVEAEDSARLRGARVLARIAGAGSAFDSTAPPAGWGADAESLAGAVRSCLRRHGISTESIERIVCGASGSIGGDRLEGSWLRAVWGTDRLPPVLAPKATLGEYGGGILGAGILAVEGVPFGPTAGFEEADPALRIVPHDGHPLRSAARVMLTSVGSGGAAAWAVLDPA